MEQSKTLAVSVSAKEFVTYQCSQCGHCCRHIEGCVMVESLDAYRMAKYLREQHSGVSSTDDVLLQYCEPTPLTDEGYPIYTLKTVGAEASCVFLQGNQCSIYAARPRTCRLYPFSAGPGERGRDFEYCLCFDDNQQYHFNSGKVLVKDWLCRNFPREDKEFLKLQYRIIPEIGKLMRHIPEELRRASVFKVLFYHYYNFDLDQPFLPQYEQNNRSLLHDLRQLALLD